ncbi:MAG: hypothetical protein QOE59_29 [Actinomycetota bacterium]|nr:hypothetical protein [Actinomycetota bacterium]
MGVTRKVVSLSIGAVDVQVDTERIARGTKAGVTELRRQAEIVRARAAAQPLVQITVAPPPAEAPRQVAETKRSRKSWTETLTERPELEMKWWIIWAAITIFCAVASPASLLISIPVGVYLLYARQQAAKARAVAARQPFDAEQAIREARAFGFPTDVYRTEPGAHGRHAR